MQRTCNLLSSLGAWNSVILNSYVEEIFPFPSAFSLTLVVPETPEYMTGDTPKPMFSAGQKGVELISGHLWPLPAPRSRLTCQGPCERGSFPVGFLGGHLTSQVSVWLCPSIVAM